MSYITYFIEKVTVDKKGPFKGEQRYHLVYKTPKASKALHFFKHRLYEPASYIFGFSTEVNADIIGTRTIGASDGQET